jgi:hypothetical protein
MASACHSLVEAKADCNGVITFTSSSWSTGSEGTNSKIGIYYKIGDKGTYVPVADDTKTPIVSSNGVTYAFNSANKYKFTDKFTLPNHDAAVKVTVKSKPLANWGNGTKPNSEALAVVNVPAKCTTTTSTTSTTVPQTTTTVPTTTSTTSTTVPTTTSSTSTTSTTSTTVPETTTTTVPQTTTTVADTTTTTVADSTTTTVPTEVLGEQIERPEVAGKSLAKTGAAMVGPLSGIGAGLTLTGAALVGLARRIRKGN